MMQARTQGCAMRERRCIVSGQALSETELIRFVAAPDGRVVPDLAARLPGRGMWVRATGEAIDRAVAKNLFARATSAGVHADANLATHAENLLLARILEAIGLARRAGVLITGFERVEAAIRSAVPPSVVIEASDAGADSRRKLRGAALACSNRPFVIGCFSRDALGLAVGLESIVHAGLRPGRFADRLVFDAGRLKGFRSLNAWNLEVQSGSDTNESGRNAAPAKDGNG
jgi:hypothetical protein